MVDTSQFTGDIITMISDYLGTSTTSTLMIFVVISIWSLIWKGISMWKASKKNQLPWFIILLVFNTVGILDILYVYVFSKIDLDKRPAAKK